MAFETVFSGPLEYLQSGGLAPVHGFTTRRGGVSEGHLSSLNLGIHRGDRPGRVVENHRRLAAALGYDVRKTVFTRQVHEDTVRVVTEADHGQGLFFPAPDCDGLVTNVPGTVLAAFSADCPLILFHDPDTGAVGAVHAGWRGTALGIVKRAVETMSAAFGSRPEAVRAALGPCIGPCCFETRSDVPEAMVSHLGDEALAAITDCGGGRYHVDLPALNAMWLRRAGLLHMDLAGECTACQTDRFWSHRRVGDRRGLQAAVIVCPPAEGCV